MTDSPERRGDLLRTLASGTAGVLGSAFLRTLVRHLAEGLGAELALVVECPGDDQTRARVVASWPADAPPEGTEFAVAGTPCELLAQRELVVVGAGLGARYATDPLNTGEQLDAFVGVGMRSSRGQRIGQLVVRARTLPRLDDGDRAALGIFAARAGAEIERHRSELALREREAELVASRIRVVHATDEERRRIGRDLHDGAQQRLVVLGQCLDLARRRLLDAPAPVLALLEQAREHAREAGRELRELATGLHPTGLAERGLHGALAAMAAQTPLPLRIGELPARRLPEPVEVTAYFLVSEAVTNALKHARASELQVAIRHEGRTATVEVADDGVGGARTGAGSGLAGLTERLAALGGTLELDSPPGAGTRLRARIPLAPWRSARQPVLEFGHADDGGLGERLIAQVLAGTKTASASVAREWDLEGGPPRIGERLPLLEHTGRRRGTVEVIGVTVAPFAAVDERVVDSESAGVSSVEEWRAAQRRFYDGCRDEMAVLLDEPGWRLTDDEPMVIVWFRVVDG